MWLPFYVNELEDEVRAALQTGYLASSKNDVFTDTRNYSFVGKTQFQMFISSRQADLL